MEKGKRSLEKKELSLPGSQSAWMVMESPSLTRVRVLVSKLGLPRLPRLTQWCVQIVTWSSFSCRGCPETWPKKVAGIALLTCLDGSLHNLVFVWQVMQKCCRCVWPSLSLGEHLCWGVPAGPFLLKQPRHRVGRVVARSLLVALVIQGQSTIQCEVSGLFFSTQKMHFASG